MVLANVVILPAKKVRWNQGMMSQKKDSKPVGPGTRHGSFSAINAHVGMRLKLRREMLELADHELARVSQITVEELRAYEAGYRDMDTRTLFRLATVLEVPLAWFYDGLTWQSMAALEATGSGASATARGMTDALRRQEARALLDVYFNDMNADEQARLVDIARLLSRQP